MHGLAIIALCVAASVVYGVAQDLVTAHLCVEYFTIGHPKVIDSQEPVALALAWGVLATWWVGLAGGLVLAAAARGGPWPKRSARDLVKPLGWALLGMAVTATLAGVAGHVAASQGLVKLVGDAEWRVPQERHVAFLTNLWAHLAAYGAGGAAILLVAGLVLRGRRREHAAA
ncbi:MAG: hypothetical protein AB7T63_07360 [Planctomycetota bacterium]